MRDLVVHVASTGRASEAHVGADTDLSLYLVGNDCMANDEGAPVGLHVAISTFRDTFARSTGTDVARLSTAMNAAHDVLCALRSDPNRRLAAGLSLPPAKAFSGSLTACTVRGDTMTIVGVGDDRAYLFRDGQLTVPASDDTLASAFREGRAPEGLGPDHAVEHGSIVLQVLGFDSRPKLRLAEVRLVEGDAVLLCSSAVWGLLEGDPLVWELVTAREDSFRRALEDASRRHGMGTSALRFAWRAG